MRKVIYWSLGVGGLSLVFWATLVLRGPYLRTPAAYAECQRDPYCAPNLWAAPFLPLLRTPDTDSYFESIYTAIQQGFYEPDIRLPGYGLVYGAFYLLTQSRAWAFWGVGLFQWAIWSVGLGLWLAEGARRGLPKGLLAVGAAAVVFSPLGYYIRFTVTEPCATAAGLIGLYGLYRQRPLLAGFFLTWAFFLRPVLGVWLPLGGLWLLWHGGLKRALLFSLPFALAESAWVYHNYRRYGDFRPLSGTKTALAVGMFNDFTPGLTRFLLLTGDNVTLAANDPCHPQGLLLCQAESLQTLSAWERAFPFSRGLPECTAETLRRVGAAICALRHSPSYAMHWRPIRAEEPPPSPEDCRLELYVLETLKRCGEALQRRYPAWVYTQAWWRRWRALWYIPAAQGPTSLPRKLYYGFFFALLLIALAGGGYRAFQEKAHLLLFWLFALLPIIVYTVLSSFPFLPPSATALLERRYLDLQWPFALLALAWPANDPALGRSAGQPLPSA
ncbi:MAG: hypothetical protein NZ958_01585 [Bacteroidia bacterium]|nr:hypothetical protein [Bacteroidia bacterium]MDW8089356.1 hypothetical protein [Bacteroidia bacterium]